MFYSLSCFNTTPWWTDISSTDGWQYNGRSFNEHSSEWPPPQTLSGFTSSILVLFLSSPKQRAPELKSHFLWIMYLINQLKITDYEIISVTVFFFSFFSIEFYACGCIRMLWEQQYSQTLTNSFFSFLMFFIAKQSTISGHLTLTPLVPAWENYSCKGPCNAFLGSRCPLTRAVPLYFWVLWPLYPNCNAVY